ncbi:hypothetical protein Q8A67_007144 [Cirrhinus molitorella]|uniref:HEPN domain-containing protein n=1 Tax=Cirrhinus molitorella TaxID=172907 RepID=A0AA88Q5K6_9TELE|nr:hypothetical protein Q8A67_007144 [Cirrhinus molitorella]
MGQNQNFALQALSKTVFCDISAEGLDDLKQDNEEFYVIHEEVLPLTARWLKVPFLSTRILKPEFIQAELFGIEQCGQSEPITQRIKNILKEYDEESDIFKELLQNAEDAGATTCKFLLDFRKHRDPPETLIDDGMALCNGPCLWIYNNELFSQEDWENIVKVGSASKHNNIEMIGKFGLGFNSVYHVSDIPSVLSGNTLLILDPNVTHLEKHILSKGNPGIKLDPFQERLYKRFPGQFKSFEGIFDCDLSARNSKKDYNGTLIKLPFRTLEEANKSEISSKVYDEDRIQSFKNNFTDNSETHLLFMKRIKSVSLQIVPENASTPPQDDQIQTPLKISREVMTSFAVSNDTPLQEIKSTFRNSDIACDNIIDVNKPHTVKIVQEHSEKSLTQYWLLYSCFGTQDSLQIFQRRNEQEHVFSVPIGGVAVPLHREEKTKAWSPDENLIGQVFCFLPLSIETGLPVHINGTFAVTSNRKGLWEKGVKSEWNKALLKDAVTSAYITALLELKKMAQNGHIYNYSFYAFWPNREKASKAFLPLVESFYSTVAQNGNCKSLDLFSNGNNWCSIEKVRFLNPTIEKNQVVGDIAMKMFLSLGASYSCVVYLPTWVRDSFKYCGFKEMIKQKTIDWPEFYSIVFMNLSAVDTCNRNLLVLNAIDLNDPVVDDLLKSYPCIPTQKCQKLQFIKRLVNPSGKVACLYELEEGHILEGTANDFLSPKRIQRLSDLGMLSDRLPLEEITERAGKISSVWQQDKSKFRKCLQCLMESMKDSLEDVSSLHWLTLSQIPFLPALAPSVQQNNNNITVLKKSSEVYSAFCHTLVSMTEFTVDHSNLQIHSYDLVLQKLRVQINPPVEIVLQQLFKAHQYCNAFEKTALLKIAQTCYEFLNNYLLEQKDPNPIVGHAISYPFIFIEDHFVNVRSVARSQEFEEKPYLYVLPVTFSKFEKLWECLGVKKQFTKEQFVAAIEEIKALYGSHPLSMSDLHKCAAILNGLYEITDEIDCFIPDESGVLTSSKELSFNDSPWMPVSADVKLSHELIPRSVACHFGVKTTRHHTLEEHFVEINALLRNCLTTSSLPVLGQLLNCDSMEAVEKALAKHGIHNSGYNEKGHGSLPKPGCCIPEEWHDCLDMNFLNNFESGEYVGFSKDESGEYFYAIVSERVDDPLGQTRQFPSKFKIQVGSDDFIEVSSLDLYQFKREKKAAVSKESTSTDIEHLLTSGPPPKAVLPKTLEDIKREIDQSLNEIWKMSSEDKQKALKRLYLRWHPDKNPDNEALATEAFKYLQKRIEELQQGTTTTTAHSTSSNSRDFQDFYNMWNTEAQSHRRGRERFYQNYSRRHYNFWSYHRETPRPNREEAKRWYEQAQCDIKSAHNDTGGDSSEWCLFKVHQAVEKALIAAMYRGSGQYPNNCSITSLAQQVSHLSSQLSSIPSTVRQLTDLGVDGKKTQYPNYHQFPHIPNKQFGIDNARRALDIATNLLEKIEEYIS